MIQPGEIQSIAGKEGVRDTQIEKDYVISWVIYGIANNPFLKEILIFKGGPVLKKVYFSDYRFSEDLDFTYYGNAFNIESIRSAFTELIGWIYENSRISLSIEGETPYETGNFNFYLSYIGPLGGSGSNKDIKVDITQDELIYNTPEEKLIINSYSDLEHEKYSILCYTLGEVSAEKMRSVMQRTAPRDIYELWYQFEIEGLDIVDYIFAFQDKAKHKGYDPKELITVVERKEKI
jgi:predicted nucleotidyltransferase component of viral defense system